MSQATTSVNGKPSVTGQLAITMAALMQHDVDRDEMLRMRRVIEDKLCRLQERIFAGKKKHGRKKRTRVSNIYAKTVREHREVIGLLTKAITDHEEVRLATRKQTSKKVPLRVLQFFADCITELCGKWRILERWYKGARSILQEIKQNAEKLSRLQLAPR